MIFQRFHTIHLRLNRFFALRAEGARFSWRAALFGAVVVFWGAVTSGHAEDLSARRARLRGELTQVLADQEQWLGDNENAVAWNRWLKTEELQQQLDSTAQPNVSQLYQVLRQYSSQVEGLDHVRFTRVREALERWVNVLPEPRAVELAALARVDTRDTAFIGPAQLSASRLALEGAFARLQGFLVRGGANGQAWLSYLQCEDLARELRDSNATDLERLTTVLAAYESGHAGLERPEFRDVQHALIVHCQNLRAAQLEDQSAAFRTNLELLAEHLEQAANQPETSTPKEIGARLAWFDQHGFASPVVRAVKRHYLQPNLYLQINGDLIFRNFEQTIDEPVVQSMSLNGANVRAQGRLTGRVTFQLEPNAEQAAVNMLLHGIVQSSVVGQAGPVGFAGTGTTRVDANKHMFLNADGVRSELAAADAQTSLAMHSLWSRFQLRPLDRVARRVGWNRIDETQGSNESQVSQRVEREITQRFEQEARDMIGELNDAFFNMLQVPLRKYGVFPRELHMSTTDQDIRIRATLAAAEQLAAHSSPPEFGGKSVMTMAMHESLINNSAAIALAGRAIQSEELANLLEQLIGQAPEGFDSIDGIPWSMTMDDDAPLEVRLHDGTLAIIIRFKTLVVGGETFDGPFAVTAIYRGAIEGNAVELCRQGDLDFILPAQSIPTPDQADLLERIRERFAMILTEQMQFSPSQLPFEMPPGVELAPTAFEIANGWLLFAVDTIGSADVLARGTSGAR